MTALVACAIDLDASSDEALRQAHARATRRQARLAVIHAIPAAADADAVDLIAKARAVVSQRVAAVTGAAGPGDTIVIACGAPHTVVVHEAEAMGADVLVVGSGGATSLSRQLLGSEADRMVRNAHCPVLVARPSPRSRKIVAATDFSDPSLPAIEMAVDEARQRSAALTLLHSIDVPRYLAALGPETLLAARPADPSAIDELEALATERLTAAVKRFGIEADTVVSAESPARAIVGLAEEREAELVVIGTIGRGGIRRVVLGSVAEQVVMSAPCSVLVVRLHRES